MNTITINTIDNAIADNVVFIKGTRVLWTDGPLVRTDADMFQIFDLKLSDMEILESDITLLQVGNVEDTDGCYLVEIDPSRIHKDEKGRCFYLLQEQGKVDHIGLIEPDRSGKYWTCTHAMPCEAQSKPPFAPSAYKYWDIPLSAPMGSVLCKEGSEIRTDADLTSVIRKLLK